MADVTIVEADERIQRDVLAELKWDARVHPNEVGVAVKEGVVTLTGAVDSYAKQLAVRDVALRVRGVRAVADDLAVRVPSHYERTDADIAAAAVRALEWSMLLPADTIQVTVANGWVELGGEVDWPWQREDAERAVHPLTGVRGVTNGITVYPRVRPRPAEVKRKIEDALVRDAATDATNIRVEVRDATVILEGAVRTWAEKDEARRVASRAPGVARVDNRLTISS